MRPPATAPNKNPAKATEERATESPLVPARAKPSRTMLPVMLAVNTRPSARKLTASTIPVPTVMPNRTKACRRPACSSPLTKSKLWDVSMFPLHSGLRTCCAVMEAIDDDLGNNDATTHRQNDREGDHSVRDRCTQEWQSDIRAIGKLQEAAGHPEEEDSRHQRNH